MSQVPSFDWETLLLYIRERQVVPIVGSELSLVSGEGRVQSLDRHIARRLVERLDIDTEQLPSDYGINDVATYYVRARHGDRSDLCVRILSILEEVDVRASEALLRLAAITDFKLFVTTTFDSLLTRALEHARGVTLPERNLYAYSLRARVADIDEQLLHGSLPVVYHLFGRASASGDYVLTDEDRLEFVYSLQSEARRPALLFDHLRDSHLLLLGCSFPDWLTRFLLRTLRRDRLGGSRHRSEALADDQTLADRNLVVFLSDCRVRIYPGGGTHAFLAELSRRWQAAQPVTSEAPPLFASSARAEKKAIFLSYASEDLETVLRLKATLEAAGLTVWFDQRALEPGDEYKEVIADAIRHCVFFFPCISASSLTPELRRFFRFEWRKALEEDEFRDKQPPFIQPILLDDTPSNSPRIPPDFRKLHMQTCPGGVPPSEFVALTRERLRDHGAIKG